MRGILKSVSGDPIAGRQGAAPSPDLLTVLDGRVEVTILLDDPSRAEINHLIHGVGRDYYKVERYRGGAE